MASCMQLRLVLRCGSGLSASLHHPSSSSSKVQQQVILIVSRRKCGLVRCANVGSTGGSVRRQGQRRRQLLAAARAVSFSSSTIANQSSMTRTTSTRLVHSSVATKQSTTTMDFVHSAPSVLTKSAFQSVPTPSLSALRTLFVASAIPMVGFGFMDNFVMIQAGQYIDSTLGVSLGLATMTAAAAGQVVSDVSGVVFGGTLERFLQKLSLIDSPALSTAQRQLSVCRNVSMAGAVVGVIFGCALGATTLMLVDLEARDRIERAMQLREIVTDMISQQDGDDLDVVDDNGAVVAGAPALLCETCCIYLTSGKEFDVDNMADNNHMCRTRMDFLQSATTPDTARQCAKDRQVLLDADSHGRVLFAPVIRNGDVMAVLEFRHKLVSSAQSSMRQQQQMQQREDDDDDGNDDDPRMLQRHGTHILQRQNTSVAAAGFTAEDMRTAQVLSRHLAIFMDRVVEKK